MQWLLYRETEWLSGDTIIPLAGAIMAEEVVGEVEETPPSGETPKSGDTAKVVQTEPKPEDEAKVPPTEKSDAASDKASEPVKPVPKKSDSRQKRIAELSYANRELNRRVDRLVGMLEKGQTQTTTDAKPPKIEDFETIDEYLNARDSYRDSKMPKGDTKDQASEYETYTQNAIEDLRVAGSDKYEDFEELVFADNTKITPVMRDTIFSLDDPDMQTEVAYFLGKNPKETTRISRLPPIRQVAEIGKLEAKISAQPAPKRPSGAPAPIKPVGGGNTATDAHNPNDDFLTFRKKRNKELGR